MTEKDLYAKNAPTGGAAEETPAPAPAGGAKVVDESLLADLEARQAVEGQKRSGLLNITLGTPRIPDAILTAFLRQMVMQLEAGVTLLKGLTVLAQRSPDRNFRNIILDVGRRVEGGSTLWEAFDAHPKQFDRLFVNLIKAGEASGTLSGVMNRVATFREKRSMLRRQVRSAMVYPSVICMISLTVIILFLTLVLPGFEDIFGQFDLKLPVFTRMALWLSRSLIRFWYLYVAAAVGAVVGVRAFMATRGGRMATDRFKMRVPVFGGIVTRAVVADFSRTFATLLHSGVSILETLDLTRDAIGNTAFAVDVQHMRDSIERGEGLEAPLRRSHLMPAIVTDMYVTGEESGALETIANQVATIYELEVEAAVLSLKNLIEPVMILFLGVVLGGLTLSFFLPYVSLLTQIMEGDMLGGG